MDVASTNALYCQTEHKGLYSRNEVVTTEIASDARRQKNALLRVRMINVMATVARMISPRVFRGRQCDYPLMDYRILYII